jgi:hypothetical protein
LQANFEIIVKRKEAIKIYLEQNCLTPDLKSKIEKQF